MGKLLDQIRRAVVNDEFVTSNHADDRLRERKITLWQIIAEIDRAVLIDERPADQPNPTVVLEQQLADGCDVRVVWSWIEDSKLAKLVTVHFI
jgi:hypothetical protein